MAVTMVPLGCAAAAGACFLIGGMLNRFGNARSWVGTGYTIFGGAILGAVVAVVLMRIIPFPVPFPRAA
jgi:hypothetical protein